MVRPSTRKRLARTHGSSITERLFVKVLLMQMMELADFRELSQGLAGEGKSLTKAQMKMLEQCLERKSSAGGSSGSGAH